jgi:hypothetical protein
MLCPREKVAPPRLPTPATSIQPHTPHACLQMLELFGAAEAAGAFLCTSRNRAATHNHRMTLDANLLAALWGSGAVCKTDAHWRALLAALPPRDRLRLLGRVSWQRRCAPCEKALLAGAAHTGHLLEAGCLPLSTSPPPSFSLGCICLSTLVCVRLVASHTPSPGSFHAPFACCAPSLRPHLSPLIF